MTTHDGLAIEATGLVKTFGETRAVDGVDLAVRAGSVYGVLGPERRRQDHHDPDARHAAAARRRVGARARATTSSREADAVRGARQPDRPARLGRRGPDRAREPDPARPAARPRPRRRRRRAPTSCSRPSASTEAAGRLVKNYSGGMRRRLDIAASIVVTPELMFLDEPTTGLDPRSRNQVWDIVRALVGRRHDDPALHPVPRRGRPARRRDRGHRPRQGDRRGHARPAQGLGRRWARCTCACSTRPQRPEAERAAGARARRRCTSRPTRRRCRPRAPDADRARRGASPSSPAPASRIADFSLGQPSLDEVFLALTGHPAEEAEEDDGGMSDASAPTQTRPAAEAAAVRRGRC